MSVLASVNLTKKYNIGLNEVTALENININVDEGEFVSIMGPSGSGKSTLLHLFGGLDRATSGQILLNETDLTVLDEEKLASLRLRQIGFVFQSYNLLPVLSAEENAALPLIIDGLKPPAYRKKVVELFELLGMSHRLDHKVNQLSGGEQQRVAIARALITKPTIVMADEPTGNLDSIASEEIVELLKKSCSELGQTIVMVTHDPKMSAYSDRIIFLKDGRVIDEEKLGGVTDKNHLSNSLHEIEVG